MPVEKEEKKWETRQQLCWSAIQVATSSRTEMGKVSHAKNMEPRIKIPEHNLKKFGCGEKKVLNLLRWAAANNYNRLHVWIADFIMINTAVSLSSQLD